MYHPSGVAWVIIIVIVLGLLTGVVVWARVAHNRRRSASLTVRLSDDLAAPPAGRARQPITHINLRVTNGGDQPIVIDGVGYRRVGSARLIPVRQFGAPGRNLIEAMAEPLSPPPYRLAAGESRVVTLYAPAICPPQELAALYLHTSTGELAHLPAQDISALTRAFTWQCQPSRR